MQFFPTFSHLYPSFIHPLSILYPTFIQPLSSFIEPLSNLWTSTYLSCSLYVSAGYRPLSNGYPACSLSKLYQTSISIHVLSNFLSKFYPASIHNFFEPVSLYPPFIQPSITPLSSRYPTSLPTFCPSFLNFFYPLLIHPLNPSQPFTQPLSTLYPCFIQPLANLYPTIQLPSTFDPLFTHPLLSTLYLTFLPVPIRPPSTPVIQPLFTQPFSNIYPDFFPLPTLCRAYPLYTIDSTLYPTFYSKL